MLTSTHARAARRGAGRTLMGSAQAAFASPKQTHKLVPMSCVLWMRDMGAYLRSADLVSRSVRTTANPHEALCLSEDVAEQMGQDIIDATGLRVELRPYRGAEQAGA